LYRGDPVISWARELEADIILGTVAVIVQDHPLCVAVTNTSFGNAPKSTSEVDGYSFEMAEMVTVASLDEPLWRAFGPIARGGYAAVGA